MIRGDTMQLFVGFLDRVLRPTDVTVLLERLDVADSDPGELVPNEARLVRALSPLTVRHSGTAKAWNEYLKAAFEVIGERVPGGLELLRTSDPILLRKLAEDGWAIDGE